MTILSPFMVYLAMQADKIGIVALAISLIFIIITIASMVASDGYPFHYDTAKAHRLRAKKSFAAALICALIFTVMPSTRTIVAMAILPPIANNEHVQALPEDLLKFVRGFIHEHTFNLSSPEKEKGTWQ